MAKFDGDYLLLRARMLNAFGRWSEALVELDSFKNVQPDSPYEIDADFQRAEALDALFGGPAPRSDVEKAAMGRAGAPEANIRSTVADPKTNTVDKSDVTRDILNAPSGDGREAQAKAGQ